MQNGRTHESLKQEIKIEKIDLYQSGNMRIGKIAIFRGKYENWQNCQFFELNKF